VSSAVISGDVATGIAELEGAFRGRVSHEPDGSGGAYVTVDSIELSERWTQLNAPLTFHLAYNYPASAIYPFYLPADVVPVNGSLPPALQPVQWRERNVIQVSLRHTNWDPRRDIAVGAVMQTQDWLQRQ
jgi:hypothetical protein